VVTWLPRDDAVALVVVVLVGRVAVVAARGLRGLVNVPPMPRCCDGGGAAAGGTRLSLWKTLTLAGAARGGRNVASHVPVLKSQVCPQRRAADHGPQLEQQLKKRFPRQHTTHLHGVVRASDEQAAAGAVQGRGHEDRAHGAGGGGTLEGLGQAGDRVHPPHTARGLTRGRGIGERCGIASQSRWHVNQKGAPHLKCLTAWPVCAWYTRTSPNALTQPTPAERQILQVKTTTGRPRKGAGKKRRRYLTSKTTWKDVENSAASRSSSSSVSSYAVTRSTRLSHAGGTEEWQP
jgi:hypothetical protein